VDGGTVEIAAHLVYDLNAEGRRLQVKKYTDYTGEKVRSMYPSAAELRAKWSDGEERAAIIEALAERGITFEELAEAAKQPDADPFDLLCHVAYSAPIRTRRERAETTRADSKAFFDAFTDEARQVLDELLEKYVEFGAAQFQIPDALKVPPISQHGNVVEIASLFGGGEKLRTAIEELQRLLYVA
jgi:type I restriction enzyme R subunit